MSGPELLPTPADRTDIPMSIRPDKIKPWHLERLALVYVRQSSPQQVIEHKESAARQYGLVHRAVALGWPRERVLVIDEDQGRSGQTIDGRPGFQRLLAEVGLDHVGLVLGLEMSRLARSCKDWYQLLELCALFRTLVADQDGVYDPKLDRPRRAHGGKQGKYRPPLFWQGGTTRPRLARATGDCPGLSTLSLAGQGRGAALRGG